MSQFLHEASIGSPEKPTYGNKKAKKKSGHCETKEKEERNRRKKQKMETINNTKKKMHATLKLNKFHSLTFAGQTRYTIPEITWLYPQEKFLLRSTSRYTYVLCIVYKCWCSCERGIFVWRESHPRKKKKRKIRLSLQLHIYTRRLPYPNDACVYTRHRSGAEPSNRIPFINTLYIYIQAHIFPKLPLIT